MFAELKSPKAQAKFSRGCRSGARNTGRAKQDKAIAFLDIHSILVVLSTRHPSQLLYGCMLMQWSLLLIGRRHHNLLPHLSGVSIHVGCAGWVAGAPSLGDYFDNFPGFDSDLTRDDLCASPCSLRPTFTNSITKGTATDRLGTFGAWLSVIAFGFFACAA